MLLVFFFHSFAAETKGKTKGIYNNTDIYSISERAMFFSSIIIRYRNVRLKYG